MSSELRPVVAHADLVRLKGRARTVSPVLLVAPSGPRDVMAVRNELARIEARGGVAMLDDAATLFGGTANWDSPAEFHARNASSKMRRARDLEVEAYGHLAFAAAMAYPLDPTGHHLLIIGVNPRTYLHFSQMEFTFICNSSYEYLQWINSLQAAYKQSHPFNNTMRAPFEYDFDERRSIASDGRSIASQQSYHDGMGRRNTAPASTAYTPTIRARSASRSRSRPRQPQVQQPFDYYQQQNYGEQNGGYGYAPQQQEVTARRSVPNMAARGISPGRRYYQDTENDYDESTNEYDEFIYRQQQSRLLLQQHQQQQQNERFHKSKRPTKLDADDEYNDMISRSPIVTGRTSAPRDTASPKKTTPPAKKAQPYESPSKKSSTRRNSLTTEEVYEMTVQAYKAGLADEVDDDRAQRNSKRFSAGAGGGRAGYPTRAGSQVRFTGEDEVAVDMRVLSSDGSSMASRGSSLQRREDGGEMVKQQQRSLSVDPRVSNGHGWTTGSPQPWDAYGYTLRDPYSYSAAASRAIGNGSGNGGIPMSKRSYSVDVHSKIRSPSVDNRRGGNQVPMNSKLNSPQEQPFAKAGFSALSMGSRSVSKDSRKQVDVLLEDNRTKKEQEASEKKTVLSSSNDHAKNYLLAKLFGKGSASRNDSVRSDIIHSSSDKVTFSKAQLNENTRLNAANGGWKEPAYLGASPTPPAPTVSAATASSTYSTAMSRTSLLNTVLNEAVRSSPEPSASLQEDPSALHAAERQVKQVVATATASSSASSSQKSSPDRIGSSNSKANVFSSPHYEFMTNEMMAAMQQVRGNVPTSRGLTGATASSLGFYDEEGLSPMIRSALEYQKGPILDSDSSFGADAYTLSGMNSLAAPVASIPIARIPESVAGITKIVAFSEPSVAATMTTGLAVNGVSMQAKYSPVIPPAETLLSSVNGEARDVWDDARSTTIANTAVTTTVTTKAASPTSPAILTAKEGSSSFVRALTPVSHATSPISRSTTPTQSQSEAGVYSPRRTANSAALRESLMATLQASPSFKGASVVKTDRERLARTLQKMDPVAKSPATGTASVMLPAAIRSAGRSESGGRISG
ncbi:hypothetical protein BC830DRAFT_1104909 [Chytriomyces sp. MP71]|nr:hypothetical protein BC830DRAFT_1104909 [Chytriomyces sp. MP71]